MKQDYTEIIHAVGIWALRALLLIGGVTAGIMGKEDVAAGCIMALMATFYLL